MYVEAAIEAAYEIGERQDEYTNDEIADGVDDIEG